MKPTVINNDAMGKPIVEVLIVLMLSFISLSLEAGEPYKDASLCFEQRADDLLSRLTLEEKVGLMMDVSQPVERLGIKPYNWWNEALHGVARSGLATVFPQPIGLGATFDNDAVFEMFNAVSDEARAKHTDYLSRGERGRYQGLTVWTPNINIFRDPRWGRGIETYGEDPYLTSVMGVAAVKGLQGPLDGKYDKMHACAKHFAVHSGPEWNRHSFDANGIAPRDLHETYLPAFKALVQQGGVKEVMCAYNRFEGQPCCGSDELLMNILRGDWGFNGVVVADCGAIHDFYRVNAHETYPDAASASAVAVKMGTDLDCGSSYRALIEGVKNGYISEGELDVSVRRLLLARFQLGEMDNPEDVSWSHIPYSVVASEQHDKLALEMARKSMTLLMNKNNVLPLKRGGLTVAVMGPNANDSVMQWGNYNGTPPRTITILKGIRAALGEDDRLMYEPGCEWVGTTLMQSAFNQCSSDGAKGFSAKYWNNMERDGEADVLTRVDTPFSFCTTGATVFAPGVNLTNFTATYSSLFIPVKSGEVVFDFYVNGTVALLVNDEEVRRVRTHHGANRMVHTMRVEAGKSYDIKINFDYSRGDAELNFDFGFKEEIDMAKSIAKVKDADVVLFVGGISPTLEGEEMGVKLPGFRGGDRTDIELPEVQRAFIKALHEAGKKVIFVNCSGSPIGLEPETEACEAILQVWYPGQAGGTAVAEVLFGDYNPAGRLPVTFYRNISQLPDFEDYSMADRTYRYMKDEPLFPFGYGLSYTSFEYGRPKVDRDKVLTGETVNLTVPVTNSGEMDGDEVVQVYLRKQGDKDGPDKTLRAFRRVFIPSGETRSVTFELRGDQFEWWNPDTESVEVYPGDFELLVGGSSKESELMKITVSLK
jgi:beta-glucosidase